MSAKSVLGSMTQQDWEIIGLKATVVQQAQMIEHLRDECARLKADNQSLLGHPEDAL